MTTEAHRSFARALARLLPSRPALVAVLLGGAAMGSTAGAFAGEPAVTAGADRYRDPEPGSSRAREVHRPAREPRSTQPAGDAGADASAGG